MKLVVQIPAHNEEQTIARTIQEIPRHIQGIDRVEIIVIDDGSTDRTAELAKQAGADLVVQTKTRTGLANAFRLGLETSLKRGADIIVNTDADNQYPGNQIPTLLQPILKKQAQMVIAQRNLKEIPGYPFFKLLLQYLGSWFVSILAGVKTPDPPSGFRAFDRDTALQLNILGKFSYTIESIIWAGRNNIKISWIPLPVNPQPDRKSRLYSSIPQYLIRSIETMIKTFSRYEPFKIFLSLGTLIFSGGFGIGIWFLYYYFTAGGKGHIQILILSAILLIIGFQVMLIGLLADLIATNRKLLEELIYRVRKLEVDNQKSFSE